MKKKPAARTYRIEVWERLVGPTSTVDYMSGGLAASDQPLAKGWSREHRWRFIAKNGEILASGEGYKRKVDLIRCLKLIRDHFGTAEVVGL